PLSLVSHLAGVVARCPSRDGLVRGWRDHGRRASRASGRRRAVPPRVRAHRARLSPARSLSARQRCAGRRAARPCGSRVRHPAYRRVRSTPGGARPVTAAPAAPGRVPNDADHPLIWIGGRRGDAPDAGISPLDRGFTLADGLFETMCAYHGTVFRLDAHLRRLAAGAAVLGIPVPGDVPRTVATASGVVRELGWTDAALRLTVTRGVGPRGLSPPVRPDPTVVLTVNALPPREPLSARTVRVCTAPARRNEFAATTGVKTLAYVESVVAQAHARAAGADDAIFLDTAGHVSEATAG